MHPQGGDEQLDGPITRRHFAQQWVQQGVANIPAVARHANLHALDGCFPATAPPS